MTELDDRIAEVTTTAAEHGFTLSRRYDPPFGWELHAADGHSPVFGSLNQIAEFLHREHGGPSVSWRL
ncbi:hypothetical protein OG563_06040 [Nocardia vinacea]|uniref:Uncharacterized protein n=1 Tax=Nocardia vinacea TaxID=96468 RepID=A0ABZ1YWX4_9NOCA|nr:hypothetical protein [Nocardia vinacea]